MSSFGSPSLRQVGRTYVREGRRTLSYFGGCDYFRMSSHPRVLSAVRRTLARDGLSVSASRTTTGNHPLYQALESELAEFFHCAAAALVSNGYTSNLAVAQALQGKFDRVVVDEKAHAALRLAAQNFGATVITFKHCDPADVARIVTSVRSHERVILLTDGMFALTGRLAPIREYQRILPGRSVVLVDDAHAAGVVGERGQGSTEGLSRSRIIQTITLSKAFGSYGGAVLGSRALCRAVVLSSGVYAGSTPVPLPCAQAARTALRLLKANPRFKARLGRNASFFRERLRAFGVSVRSDDGPIVALRPASARARLRLDRALRAAGIHPPFLTYGSNGSGCYRFAVSSEHSESQLLRVTAVLAEFREELEVE